MTMRDVDERTRSLAGVPMLAGLAGDANDSATPMDAGPYAELAARAEPISVRAGDWVFRQGDPGDSLFVVLTGRLEVMIEDAEGLKVIRILGRGSSVGELALLTD